MIDTMKNKIFFIIIFICNVVISQKTQDIYISSNGFDSVYDIDIDDMGNIYATGFFQESLNNIKSSGGEDVFVAKYNSENKLIWIKQIGSDIRRKNVITEYGKFIKVKDNKIYVTGILYEKKEDNSELIRKVFLFKYDANGNLLWGNTLDTSDDGVIEKILFGDNENIYLICESHKESNKIIFNYNKNGKLLETFLLDKKSNEKVYSTKLFNNKLYFIKETNERKVSIIELNLNNKEYKEIYKIINNYEEIKINIDVLGNVYVLQCSFNKREQESELSIYKIDKDIAEKVLRKKYNYRLKIERFDNSDKLNEKILIGQFLSENEENQQFSTSNYNRGSIAIRYDLTSNETNELFVYEGSNQSKIFNIIFKNKKMYYNGHFFDKIKKDKEYSIFSKGKTDGFISVNDFKVFNHNRVDKEKKFMIFPNPTEGEFYISDIEGVDVVLIYDMQGRLVFKKDNLKSSIVNVKNLESSNYFLHLLTKENTIEIIKLIIK